MRQAGNAGLDNVIQKKKLQIDRHGGKPGRVKGAGEDAGGWQHACKELAAFRLLQKTKRLFHHLAVLAVDPDAELA